MHIGTQGARVLLFVFIKQGDEVKRLHGIGRFLPKDGAVVLYAGKTADPGKIAEKCSDPVTSRGFVGIEHDAFKAAQLHVNPHHAVGQSQSLR